MAPASCDAMDCRPSGIGPAFAAVASIPEGEVLSLGHESSQALPPVITQEQAADDVGGHTTSLFSEQVRGQLWRSMGMVQKALPPRPVPCAGNVPQSRAKQLAAHWAGPSRLASASFSGDPFSRSSACASGCVSLTMPPGDRNPKSLKMAAIRQYEAAAEGSEASGALSDSTGVSPAHLNATHGAASVQGGPASPWMPQSSSGGVHSGGSAPPSSFVAVGGNGYDGSCSGFDHWAPPQPLSPRDGGRAQQLSAAFSMAAPLSAGSGSTGWGKAQLKPATSWEARSGGSGWGSPQEEDKAVEMVECLLCGLTTCPAKGPHCIRCSDCRGAMHKECFVGHYHVVPGRRDWTYCPAHSLSLQAEQAYAKAAERGKAVKARTAAKRRFVYADEADGDALSTPGSRSARSRRARRGDLSRAASTTAPSAAGDPTTDAAAMDTGDPDFELPSRAVMARRQASSRSEIGGRTTAAAAAAVGGDAAGGVQVSTPMTTGRPMRRRQTPAAFAALIAAEREADDASEGEEEDDDEVKAHRRPQKLTRRSGDNSTAGTSVSAAGPPGAVPRAASPQSPTGNSESGSVADVTHGRAPPPSPRAVHPAAAAAAKAKLQLPSASSFVAARDRRVGNSRTTTPAPASDPNPSSLKPISVGRPSDSVRRSSDSTRASVARASAPRRPPQSPPAARTPLSPRSPHARRAPSAKGAPSSKSATPRDGARRTPCTAPPMAPAMSTPTAAAPAAAAATPATPDADELLAKLLHQELNASSRHRSRVATPAGPGAL